MNKLDGYIIGARKYRCYKTFVSHEIQELSESFSVSI